MTVYADGRTITDGMAAAQDAPVICIARRGEAAVEALPEARQLAQVRDRTTGTRFESRQGFDYLCISAPDPADPEAPNRGLEAVFTGKRLLVLDGGLPAVGCLQGDLADHGSVITPERALYILFAHLTENDAAALDDIEEEIARLEDEMVKREPEDSTGDISRLRRRLLVLKRYYEALFDLLEDMEENANGFIGKEQLRSFHIQTNRADRLNRAVLNLRDYVTQVREAYQNQLDISMNETMRLFTVISAVFLPLTLLTGWYGMNLRMPEYDQPWAYAALIAVSVVVAIVCLVIFKRKKWF